MQLIPIQTRVLQPPKDDLFAVIEDSVPTLCEGDILVISSKIVAISEGNCVPIGIVEKTTLVKQEADILIPRDYWSSPLTVKCNAFIGTAGIDESNADGHYVLLPKDPFLSAKKIYAFIKQKHQLTNVGVIISDSHSSPLRRGATGISIGYWGFAPTINHVGEKDLFGRELKIEVSNVVDGIAAAANLVMGETDECQPIVIVRDIPAVTFTDEDKRTDHLVAPADDTFRVLYERFLESEST